VPAFLVDEDLPRSTAVSLREVGHDAVDVRDVGLRGHRDDEVFAFAQNQRRVLIAADLRFARLLRFPLGSHYGIIVLRPPSDLAS